MLVYRAENEYGYGPFQGWLAYDFTEAMADAGRYDEDFSEPFHEAFPTHWEEGLSLEDCREDPLCACSSIRQWLRWFPRPCREVLAREGYHLVIFEVPEDAVDVGQDQVIFDRSRAQISQIVTLS